MLFDFRENIRKNEPLAGHSTFRIGGTAAFYAEPEIREDLYEAIQFARKHSLRWLLIGNASNILFSDEPFDGLVISLKKFETDRYSFDHPPLVRVSAGIGLPRLAQLLASQGLSGLEFVSTIPGTVGGALAMNAGYTRVRQLNAIGDWVHEVTVMDSKGGIRALRRDQIDFGYRSSSLRGQIILDAAFKLKRARPEDIYREIQANQTHRQNIQPLEWPSAGSVFKNPSEKDSAGRLIDRAGLKGLQIGDAEISRKHGNFIVNRGRARAGEVLDLVRIARDKVGELFGVILELEIKYISNQSTPAFS
jgi:UDP-N-acetylmuramate dehydrogenase